MIEHWSRERAAAFIAVPDAESNKYRRGVLAVRTGSAAYPGAAVLGVEAAWRTGAGMVRYVPPLDDGPPALGLPTPAAAVLAARPETVFADGRAALGARCDAWLMGSGTDPAERSFAEREALHSLFIGEAPVVVDAGALLELTRPEARAARGAQRRSGPVAVTPHLGEFRALWRAAGLGEPPHLEAPPPEPVERSGVSSHPKPVERSGVSSHPKPAEGNEAAPFPELVEGSGVSSASEPIEGVGASRQARTDAARALAGRLNATVLLKGSVSIVATPGGFCAAIGPATPWLATAGTGDVLAGILGALAATHAAELRDDPELFGPLAATAALLHDEAARRASPGGRAPLTALDVAHALPAVIAELLD